MHETVGFRHHPTRPLPQQLDMDRPSYKWKVQKTTECKKSTECSKVVRNFLVQLGHHHRSIESSYGERGTLSACCLSLTRYEFVSKSRLFERSADLGTEDIGHVSHFSCCAV